MSETPQERPIEELESPDSGKMLWMIGLAAGLPTIIFFVACLSASAFLRSYAEIGVELPAITRMFLWVGRLWFLSCPMLFGATAGACWVTVSSIDPDSKPGCMIGFISLAAIMPSIVMILALSLPLIQVMQKL